MFVVDIQCVQKPRYEERALYGYIELMTFVSLSLRSMSTAPTNLLYGSLTQDG